MTLISYIFSVLAAITMLVYVIEMLRKRKLRERHAIWWLVIGVLALIAALIPSLPATTAKLLGINLPISLVFFVGIVVLFLVSVQQSAELTELEEKTRILAEEQALLAEQLRKIKRNSGAPEPPDDIDS